MHLVYSYLYIPTLTRNHRELVQKGHSENEFHVHFLCGVKFSLPFW